MPPTAPEIAPMNEYKISRTAIVLIKREPYKHLGATLPGRVHLMHMTTGLPYTCEDEHGVLGLLTQFGWDELLLAGDLKVVEPPSDLTARSVARTLARSAGWTSRDILGRPEAERVKGEEPGIDPAALKSLTQVLLLDENNVPNGVIAMRKALAKLWTKEFEELYGPHDKPETIKRYRSERGTKGNRQLADFIRMWGRVDRKPYGDGVVHEVLQVHCLRARTEPGTILEDIRAEVGVVLATINRGDHEHYPKPQVAHVTPSISTVHRAWRALENSHTVAALDGDAAMRADWRGAGRPLVAKRPLEIGIIDHTKLNIMAVIDLDHDIVMADVWLSTLLDVSSRVVLAWVITSFPPSFWSVAELIRRANLPKRPPPDMVARYSGLRRICGRCAELLVDNGVEFRGHGFESAAAGAGFAVRFAPIKRPTYKAVGERFFRTIQGKLTKRLPGRTIPIATTRKREYDAAIDAVLLLDDLEAAMNQCVAEYHTELHEGIGNRQPLLMFEKGTAGFIDIAHDLDAFFDEVMDVERKVQVDMAGVTLWGLRFHDAIAVPELLDDNVPLEKMGDRREAATFTTKAKYNRMDIRTIKVWNAKTRAYVGLRCDYARYSDGMPLELHKQIRAQAEAEGAAFNTEEERMVARTRRIDAIRAIDRVSTQLQKDEFTKLVEGPRIRRITGNIVEAGLRTPTAVTFGDFIAHDNASLTSVDAEILAPRKPVSEQGSTQPKRVPARDRRDGGQPRKIGTNPPAAADATAARPIRSRGSRRVVGDYE